MTDIENKDLFENNENTTPETESADLGEENVVKDNADEMSVVSAKDSALDQTVSAVSSDAAIFERNVTDFNVEKERRKQKVGNVLKNVLVYTVLTVCAVLAFLPFYWMVISSLKTEMEYRQSVPTFFPHTFMWKNYEAVLSQTSSGGSGSFVQILINTLVVGFFSTTIGVLVTIITAYALARMKFKGKNILFTLMLATMMIPGEMYTITNYLTVSAWGWRDTFTVMILPFLVSVYYIYLLRNNFMQIPDSLYKAAKVDGLSDMGYLVKVMVPLTAPTLVSITLLKFIGTWNSYIWPDLSTARTGRWSPTGSRADLRIESARCRARCTACPDTAPKRLRRSKWLPYAWFRFLFSSSLSLAANISCTACRRAVRRADTKTGRFAHKTRISAFTAILI